MQQDASISDPTVRRSAGTRNRPDLQTVIGDDIGSKEDEATHVSLSCVEKHAFHTHDKDKEDEQGPEESLPLLSPAMNIKGVRGRIWQETKSSDGSPCEP